MGAQDNFLLAQDFIESTGAVTPTMLWDAGFDTWRAFDVRFNSQMMVASADLSQRTELSSASAKNSSNPSSTPCPELFG